MRAYTLEKGPDKACLDPQAVECDHKCHRPSFIGPLGCRQYPPFGVLRTSMSLPALLPTCSTAVALSQPLQLSTASDSVTARTGTPPLHVVLQDGSPLVHKSHMRIPGIRVDSRGSAQTAVAERAAPPQPSLGVLQAGPSPRSPGTTLLRPPPDRIDRSDSFDAQRRLGTCRMQRLLRCACGEVRCDILHRFGFGADVGGPCGASARPRRTPRASCTAGTASSPPSTGRRSPDPRPSLRPGKGASRPSVPGCLHVF